MPTGFFQRIILGTGLAGTNNADGTITVNAPIDGWISDIANTWTYASATTFTVTGNRTAVFSKGTRLKLTQTTVKYFVVTASAFGAGVTTVTLTGGSDYTLANAAISANFYSYEVNPQGYPGVFNYTLTAALGFTGALTVNWARFAVVGTVCTTWIDMSGTSNAATFELNPPITINGNLRVVAAVVTDNGVIQAAPGRCGGTTVFRLGIVWNAAGGFNAAGTKGCIFIHHYEI